MRHFQKGRYGDLQIRSKSRQRTHWAIATSMRGFLASIYASQDPSEIDLRPRAVPDLTESKGIPDQSVL
ncbi:hypothetical protein X743_32010 [Mesorhizobium sp. LNHC252B00]|nr:hypothetical protein X743_32010 [Mesorhizobium sp. LNHC252B00]